jgi:hypothetical protein
MNGNGNSFFRKFTKIRGDHPISSIRRLPWKDKIRLGIQVPTIEKDKEGKQKLDSKGNPVQKRDKFGELESHPKDVSFFVCPAEVQKRFGKEPTELDIAFPLSGLDENGYPDIGGLFPQAYKYYGSSRGLKCVGDGETAMKANEEGIFEEVECPCDRFGQKDGCSKRASLLFFIPSISIGGIYVIDSGSWNTMVDVQSGIYLALELLKDPITGQYNSITMLPFKLRRIQKETQHEKRKDKHWPLTCELNLTIPEIKKIREGQILFYGRNRTYQIEDRPEDVNPKLESKKDIFVKPDTEEEQLEREKKAAEVEEKAKAEYHQSKINEAKLKVEHEEGKDKIKSYQESKTIYKKKKEEGEKIEAELNPASLEEVTALLKEIDIQNWAQALYYARKANLKVSTEAQVKKLLTEDRNLINRIVDARGVDKPTGSVEKYFENQKGLDKTLEYKEGEQEITDEGNFP